MITFLEMATNAGAVTPEEQTRVAQAMEDAYCDALRAVSFTMCGEHYVGFGKEARRLSEVMENIRVKKGPL